jgi:glycoprotein-N-acetylgalactosamine 3-beta-galactosyltransferase
MFVDSHVEMISSTWYQHLVLPILENPHTMSVQIIDIIDDTGTREYTKVGNSYGLFNEDFYFVWQGERFGDWATKEKERPGNREPYEVPVAPGSLFAMRRDEFWRLGGYDEGLYVWGGENTELALKTWMCGGRIVMNPCSRVGHMFRKSPKLMKKQWPPKIPPKLAEKTGCNFKNATYKKDWDSRGEFGKITLRNNLRVMDIWVGEHPAKYAYYKKVFGSSRLRPEWQQYIDELKTDPAAQKQIRLKKENQCHDFEWFDKHVMMKLVGKHHPWYKQVLATNKRINGTAPLISCGRRKAKRCSLCPQGDDQDFCSGDCAWCEERKQCMTRDEQAASCRIAESIALNKTLALLSNLKPSKPLPISRRVLLSKPVDITHVNVAKNHSEHPHMGARDENKKFGYIHDETALRKNPPPFRFSTLRAACKIQDDHYQMLTKKVVVDLQRHEEADKSGRKRDKIICVAKTSEASHPLIPYVRETWGQRCDGFLAASNKTDRAIDAVDIAHEGPEVYDNLWQKFRSITSYLYDNYYDKYDWFFIADDDSFVIVENLRLYLESEEIKLASNGGAILPMGNETTQVPLLLGRRFAFKGDRNDIFPSGGAGMVLNKAALKMLVTIAINQFEPHAQVFTDDWYLACSLRQLGIVMYDTQDENKGERFMPFSPGQHYMVKSRDELTSEYDVWYKNYSLDIKFGLDHCAKHSVSFHYSRFDEAKRFFALVYGLCPGK